MRKLIWRIIFTLTALDCLGAWFNPKVIAMVWDASRVRYRSFYDSQMEAYEYLAELKR